MHIIIYNLEGTILDLQSNHRRNKDMKCIGRLVQDEKVTTEATPRIKA